MAVLQGVNCGGQVTGEDTGNAGQSDCPTTTIGWYGPYDFRTWGARYAPVPRNVYLDCAIGACSDEKLAVVSAITYVTAKTSPILMITGSVDETVPDSQSREMAAAMNAAGAPYELEFIPDVGHAWKSPDKDRTMRAYRHALDVTYRFIDRQLKGK